MMTALYRDHTTSPPRDPVNGRVVAWSRGRGPVVEASR